MSERVLAVKVWGEDDAEPDAPNVDGELSPSMAAEEAAERWYPECDYPEAQMVFVRDQRGDLWELVVTTILEPVFDAAVVKRPR